MTTKTLALLAFTLTLFSCRTTVETINEDVDDLVEEDYAYVLIGLDTNRDLYTITLSGPEQYILRAKDLDASNDYILSKVKVGDYTLSRLYTSKYSHFSFKDNTSFKFSVSPNTVSYVGHFEIVTRGFFMRTSTLQLDNRSSEAYVYMRDAFPNILRSRAMQYNGPGKDNFLNYIVSEYAQ